MYSKNRIGIVQWGAGDWIFSEFKDAGIVKIIFKLIIFI
jgi:hypothetical protein